MFFLLTLTAVMAAGEAPKAGALVTKAVSATADGVGKIDYELGTLYVPENRSVAGSRVIGVGFARFRGPAGSDVPPVFLLPGGPGYSMVDGMAPESFTQAKLFRNFIAPLRAAGDVVVVDQRGACGRGEVLSFRFKPPAQPLDEPGSLEHATEAFAARAEAAAAHFAAKKIDLRGYTVKECADDVNDLREALKYDRVSLMGGSFGSQWGFAVMRRHPKVVARALLFGTEPLDCGYDMPSYVMAAVRRIWFEAEQDEQFKPYLPEGGLVAAARAVIDRLRREPVRVPLKGVTDAKTGKPVTVVLGPEDFRWAAQRAFRGPGGPAFVLSLYHGKYRQLALSASFSRRAGEAQFRLLGPLIDTSLNVSPRRGYLLRTDPAAEFLGHWNFDAYMKTAEIWPSPDVGEDFRAEKVCRVPAVFVHGDWDTQTPVENLLRVAPYFPKGRTVLVRRGTHGAITQIAAHRPKVMTGLLNFLKTGDAAGLPARVEVPAPKFPVPSFPPPAE